MFSALAESYPEVFQRLFKLHELPEFWEQTLARDDDRLVNHPATLEKGWEQVTIPLFTHGDGVEYESRDSLMVWSFGPLLSQEQSLDSHLLMAAWPKSCTCKDTWPQLWKELAWSFKALAKGQHPTHDADGNPLKRGSPFWAKKGKPLASGLKAIVWCIEGDHEFFSNSLGFPIGGMHPHAGIAIALKLLERSPTTSSIHGISSQRWITLGPRPFLAVNTPY